MNITINGKPLVINDGSTLADAIAAAGIDTSRGIATALNNEVVAASARAATPLSEGDSIVIIRAFYGG